MSNRKEKMREYRARYWQNFKKNHRRIYGVVTQAEYEDIAAIARKNGRSVWKQVWLESQAYRRQTFLPSRVIEERIGELCIQLRKIGVNVNQIAKRQNAVNRLVAPARVGAEIAELERAVTGFVKRPWRKDLAPSKRDH